MDRALDIIGCFDSQNREFSLATIAQRTGLNKSTVFRLSSNLVNRGYLKFNPESRTYCLGMKLFELGSIVFSSFSLRKAASSHMTDLQEEISATVLLGILVDDELVYVDRREPEGMVRIAANIGWRHAPHHGMLGMVLMAWLPPDRRDDLLNKYPLLPVTSRTITDAEGFQSRLSKIVSDGYVVERGEAIEGSIGVAAPIRDYSRNVIAAVGAAILEAQHDDTSVARTVQAVCTAAEKISAELGY